MICISDHVYYSGMRVLSSTLVEIELSRNKFCRSPIQVATMSVVPVVEDDDFDQFVEEEDVIYVNYGLKMSRDKDG